MRRSSAKKILPAVATPEATASPLVKRLARWQSWAQNLKTRFAVRTSRPNLASQIFLQPRSLNFFNNPIHHWHVAWWWRMQSLQRNFGETKSVLHQLSLLRGQLDKQPANAQRLLIHAFDQTMFAPMITRQAPALDQRLQVERLLQTNATENQFITFAKALTSQPSRYSTAEMMLPAQMRGNRIFLSRLLAERHFHCRALNEVKDKFNLFHQQHWETLSQILIHSRQRAEKQRGGLSPDYREGRRQENLPSINFNAPAGPILRKSAVVRQMAPANMNSPSIPETVLPGPIPPAPPIDLNRLTEQVMQQIDRRLVIWRERSGRV